MAVVNSESPAQVSLNQTAYIVLGLLSHGYGLSGYELRQWAARSLAAFYKPPAQSQIYRELTNLEALGLVGSEVVHQVDNPDKIVFNLTRSGRHALHDWIETTEPAALVLKHPLAVQTSFAKDLEPSDLIGRIEAHIAQTTLLLDGLEDLIAGLAGDEDAALARATLEWAMKIRQADIDGAEHAQSVLRAKSAP